MPNLYGQLTPQGVLNGSLQTIVYADNYNDLINKPSINSVELQGNKTAADLGLLTAGDIPVESVNGKQGVVILDGDDIEYEAGTSVNSKITDLEAEIGSGPVVSVNGQQGVVELDGTDINYSLTKTLNQKIDEVAASIPVVSYPVTSVNTKTGDVVLDDADIEHSSGVSVNSIINTMVGYIPVYGNTASGSIATFDTSLALPLQNCTIAINAVQSGSGTPSPDNVRPITGFTGANIHVADDENPHIIDNVTAISWQSEAGTVYGGSLDVTSGVLTVDKLIVDLSTIDFNTFSNPSIHVFRADLSKALPNVQTPPNTYTATTAICSKYVSKAYTPISSEDHGLFAISDSSANRIIFIDHNCNTVEDFMTANADTQLLYPIATPVTYQLTPTQISAIVGTNNVFTDTNGDTSVVYACSLKDYIDSQ